MSASRKSAPVKSALSIRRQTDWLYQDRPWKFPRSSGKGKIRMSEIPFDEDSAVHLGSENGADCITSVF
jgi:hypothetical protein